MKHVFFVCMTIAWSLGAMNNDKSFIKIELDSLRSLYPKCILGFQPFDEKRPMYMSMSFRIISYFEDNVIEKNDSRDWLVRSLFNRNEVQAHMEQYRIFKEQQKKLLYLRQHVHKELCIKHALGIIKKHKAVRAPRVGTHSVKIAEQSIAPHLANSQQA